jgi:CheY-like chemotaxis protein
MPKKCLVVDDNIETVDIVSFILKKAGYEVVVAYDGQAGLQKAATTRPDIILLDIMMPIVDGCSMNKQLKEDPSTRDIPVIIMSARSGMEPMFEGTEGPRVQGYLVKPFDRKDLLRMIDDIFRKMGP